MPIRGLQPPVTGFSEKMVVNTNNNKGVINSWIQRSAVHLYLLLARGYRGILTFMLASLIAFSAQQPLAHAQSSENLPQLGTTGRATMSIQRELTYGDIYMRQMRGAAPIIGDPVLDEYLTDLGNRLVRRSQNVRFGFEFFWVNAEEINAFAFLGGKVGVHTGLISEAATESELASVLAHEIAHVTQRHIVRNIEAQAANSPSTLAAILAGVILAMASPDLGIAAISAAQAGAMQNQINYTRLFEMEADRIGIGILAEAGFDPQGAPAFFGRLADKYRYASKPPQMLLTHPLSESRVADTRQRADMLPRPINLNQRDFLFAKARIQARYLQNQSAQDFAAKFNDRNEDIAAAARYGAAILALDSKQPEVAAELLQPLSQRYPRDPFIFDVQTDILIALNRADAAVDMLRNIYIQRPNEPVVTLNLANAALKAGDNQLAIQLLRDFLLRNDKHVLALELLADAYQNDGQIAAMYETRGEIYAMHGGFKLAIDQFNTAHTNTDNQLTQKRLQARIDQVRSLQAMAETL